MVELQTCRSRSLDFAIQGKRNLEVASNRRQPKHWEQIKVWVRSGGHCALCHKYLLESEINYEFEKLGELAHIVAQTNSELAPRSLADMPKDERDLAENLLLACSHCHTDIDKRKQAERLDIHWLLKAKRLHEQRIREVTTLAANEKTAVLRVVGHIRGAVTEISGIEAVAAINAEAEKSAVLTLDPNRQGPEIDLRMLPGEENPIESGYYTMACERISEILTERLQPAVEREEIQHLSVFGLARLPLLVYFGSRLDDTISTDIYQRHRATESWQWENSINGLRFHYQERTNKLNDIDTEAVLVVNASGKIDEDLIPIKLSSLTQFTIEPVYGEPNRDAIRTKTSLHSFHNALSNLLGHIEAMHKKISTLHLFAAVPVSAAIILGRSIGWGFQPNLIIYDHAGSEYKQALEVRQP